MNKRVAVLRGGPSSEYEVSLKTGRAVCDALSKKHRVYDITIDTSGRWYHKGVEVKPIEVLRDIDVVFNAMHGEYGEDGKIQQLLDQLQVAYTGPRAFAAALAMHKAHAKEVFKKYNIKTPQFLIAQKTDDIDQQAADIIKQMHLPIIIKPLNRGSSVGIGVAHTFHELCGLLTSLYEHVDALLVEEYIKGKEGTVGIVEGFRNQKTYPLLPVEIHLPDGKHFFDYDCKYSGDTKHTCPGSFTSIEKEQMQEAAMKAHEALGLRHYSRSDFIVHPKRGVYILETNALPGLTKTSLLPRALTAVGASYDDFIEHIIDLAYKKV